MEKLSPKKLMLIAGALSILTAMIIYFYLVAPSKTDNAKNSVQNEQGVLVAVQDIPGRTRITAEMVKAVMVPKGYVQPGTMADSSQVVGIMTTSPILAGEQIQEKRLALRGKGDRFSSIIPQNKRAFTIAVNGITGVAGFISPGDYIDVISTMGEGKNTVSKVVLQNIEVLAVNGNSANAVTGTTAVAPASLTLAVTMEEAQKLQLVSGHLTLALRPFDDNVRTFYLSNKIVDVMGYNFFSNDITTVRPSANTPVPSSPYAISPAYVPAPTYGATSVAAVPAVMPHVSVGSGITVYRGINKTIE